MKKFLVTAFWSDGLTNVEDHASLTSAQGFMREALGCEGIVKVIIEKTNVREPHPTDWDCYICGHRNPASASLCENFSQHMLSSPR